jgi:hypothetical protein
MIKSALYILILFVFSFFSCSKSNSNREETTVDSQVVADSTSDTLPTGKGTESSRSNQPGMGTSENGLSTDVAIDSTISNSGE